MKYIVLAILIIFSISACKFSEKSVVGNYYGSGVGIGDTLIIKSDKSFLLTIKDSKYNRQSGKWSIQKKCLYLNFSDTSGNAFGGCHNLCYRFLNRKKLFRPMTCKGPTHRFAIYLKQKEINLSK